MLAFSFWSIRRSLLLMVGMAGLSLLPACGLATGVPASLSVDPATIREKDRPTTPFVVTVILQNPAPDFFVCALRSDNPRKLTIGDIIFKKGQTTGTAAGVITWKNVPKEARVRLSAYSAEAPDRKLAFSVALKPRGADEQPQRPMTHSPAPRSAQ